MSAHKSTLAHAVVCESSPPESRAGDAWCEMHRQGEDQEGGGPACEWAVSPAGSCRLRAWCFLRAAAAVRAVIWEDRWPARPLCQGGLEVDGGGGGASGFFGVTWIPAPSGGWNTASGEAWACWVGSCPASPGSGVVLSAELDPAPEAASPGGRTVQPGKVQPDLGRRPCSACDDFSHTDHGGSKQTEHS